MTQCIDEDRDTLTSSLPDHRVRLGIHGRRSQCIAVRTGCSMRMDSAEGSNMDRSSWLRSETGERGSIASFSGRVSDRNWGKDRLGGYIGRLESDGKSCRSECNIRVRCILAIDVWTLFFVKTAAVIVKLSFFIRLGDKRSWILCQHCAKLFVSTS
ncbi:hypothetical protein F4782DRAFT_407833 [Xylaria castorea]|nr:hypothetical protein F4782DRAFT_407833 [Xylaria castorea]